MEQIFGKGVSKGVAAGPISFYRRLSGEIPRCSVTDTAAELARFHDACETAKEQLGVLHDKALAEAGEDAAMLFEAHQMMLDDLDFVESIEGLIENDRLNAEAAVSDTGAQFAEMFAAMDDSYMQARAADIDVVLQNDGGGIGLFRSEFLYLQGSDYPTEDEQFEAYKTVAERMGGRRVIIRTLDIGADKQADYFHLDKEENPAMGLRAIRICLTRPEVFRTQLRALYRASAYGKIAIMFPMITSVWEVQEIKRICRNIRAELAEEGVPMADKVELGIMIETPAAVMMSAELAREVDFFSVGTNDLTQYTLAVDRQGVGLDRFFDAHHPAVLRMLRMAAENAHKAGIWIGICGELGADAELTETFLSMGIDELSVSPSAVLPLRSAIRSIDTTTLAPLEL